MILPSRKLPFQTVKYVKKKCSVEFLLPKVIMLSLKRYLKIYGIYHWKNVTEIYLLRILCTIENCLKSR